MKMSTGAFGRGAVCRGELECSALGRGPSRLLEAGDSRRGTFAILRSRSGVAESEHGAVGAEPEPCPRTEDREGSGFSGVVGDVICSRNRGALGFCLSAEEEDAA